ncbi:MAG: hypothetical protein Q4F85_04925 [Prevotella sp.]|nr:hypothetical protein [Prevotella sp.]
MAEKHNRQETPEESIKNRYSTFVRIYNDIFLKGLGEKYSNHLYLSKELLHCAVTAYFDDIQKFKNYAGSTYADCHKQAAYTMLWITRFKPIQLRETAKADTTFLTINEIFAVFVGLTFLNDSVNKYMSKTFYKHLIYTLVYRNIDAKGLASLLYVMERASQGGCAF